MSYMTRSIFSRASTARLTSSSPSLVPPERQPLLNARRVVVKVGTAVVSNPDGSLALSRMGALVEQLRELTKQGRQVKSLPCH